MLFNILASISLEMDNLELKIWRFNDCLVKQSFPKSDFEFINTDPETFCKDRIKSLRENIEVYNNFIKMLIDLIWMREPKKFESMHELADEILAFFGLGAHEECSGYPYFGDAVGFLREICENIPMYWKGRIIGRIRKSQHRHKISWRI